MPPKMDFESRNELRRKKLCFTCKEPWTPEHRCLGKGKIHYIEVTFDVEDEQVDDSKSEESNENEPQEQPQLELDDDKAADQANVTIATLLGVPKYHTFRLKGVLKGQRAIGLVDMGATHNFIDEKLVVKCGLQDEQFSGFNVRVADGSTMSCMRRVPQCSMKMGDYTLTDDFYVVSLRELDIILGMQWLETLGRYIIDHCKRQLEFIANGKKIVLKFLSDGRPRIVSTHKMEAIFRHVDIAWAA